MISRNKGKTEQQNFKQQAFDYEKMMSEQKERIFELIDENKKLKDLNDIYRKKDEEISGALMLAVQKANEYETASKIQYELEVKRIKVFHQKWISYFNKIKELLPEDKNLIAAEKLIKDMDMIVFNSDKNLKKEQIVIKEKNKDIEIENQYKAEKERLEELNKNDLYEKYSEGYNENAATLDLVEIAERKPKLNSKEFAEIIEKVRVAAEKNKQKNIHAIDLEEVINPKNLPDLEVLCSELGLGLSQKEN